MAMSVGRTTIPEEVRMSSRDKYCSSCEEEIETLPWGGCPLCYESSGFKDPLSREGSDELVEEVSVQETLAVGGPKGLGGWLSLLCFLLVMSFMSLSVAAFPRAQTQRIHPNPWNEIADPQLESLNRFGTVGSGILLVGIVVLLNLYWRRSYLFPRLFIAFSFSEGAFQIAHRAFITSYLQEEFLSPESIVELLIKLFHPIVWTIYILRSRRVKNTFVEANPFPRLWNPFSQW